MKIHGLPKTLRGERLHGTECAGFEIVETVYPSDFKQPRHLHELTHLSLVLQGSYTEHSRTKMRPGASSTLVFHPQGESHSVDFHEKGARIFSVVISPHWLGRVREHTSVLDTPHYFLGGLPVSLALRLYREFQNMDEFSPLVMEALALEILAESSRQSAARLRSKCPRWLKQAEEIARTQFAEIPRLSEIARSVGVHPTHLSRRFRAHFGCTIGEYVRRFRIEQATIQLANSNTPLHEIAASTGFADQSHFARIFKRYSRLSPNEYRKTSQSR